jgi:hypothetical protein
MSKILKLLACSLALGCSGEAMDYERIEQTDQPISTFAAGGYGQGTCDSRRREKCSYIAACPGNKRCIVPATKHLKVALIGDDFNQGSTSWKFEVRRMLGPVTQSTGDIAVMTGWSSEETTEVNANLIVQRSFCSCVTPACDTPADLTCYQEPVGAGAQLLTETLPGTYARPGSSTVKRYMFLNVDRLIQLKDLYNLTTQDYHFVLEHTVRWGMWSMLGIGAYGVGQQDAWPSAFSTQFVMRNAIQGTSGYNFMNLPELWEQCMTEGYSLSQSFNYNVVPVGCGANGEN